MSHKKEMIGKRFGRLVVIEECGHQVKPSGQKMVVYKCKCDCGNQKIAIGSKLRLGLIKSCGCLKAEQRVHGACRLAHIWNNMKARCNNPKSTSYKNYGLRGISVCDEWENDYNKFKQWALNNGYSKELTLDRIDPDGNYCPNNCRWATPEQQANNTRSNVILVYYGTSHTVAEWSRMLGISPARLYSRKAKGMHDDEIFKDFPEVAELLKKMREES